MLNALITLAAGEGGHETSKTLFYVLGGVAAAWAVFISAVGIMRHETFPPSKGAARAIMAISALTVLGAMAGAIITS